MERKVILNIRRLCPIIGHAPALDGKIARYLNKNKLTNSSRHRFPNITG